VVALFAGNAPTGSDALAVVEVGIAIGLLVGMFVVRAGHIRVHKYLQLSMVFVNIPIVLAGMVPPFLARVLPDLPGELASPYYLFPTLAVFAGGAAEALGIYIVLVAGTNLLPERWRFRNYKRWMRTELVLWWAVVGLGLAIYIVWYALPPSAS
jgi:uncharacterized membrane protein YozB (DUF420 family)